MTSNKIVYRVASKGQNDWTPLYLSCIAGASTCIGAAIVFCLPKANNNENKSDVSSSRRVVHPGTMTFSLSLAGSVMVTVSLISILPEVFMDTSIKEDEDYKMMPVLSIDMLCRLFFIFLGALLYFILSWCLIVPDPENLLYSENFDTLLGSNSRKEVEFDMNEDNELEGGESEANFDDMEAHLVIKSNESIGSAGGSLGEENLHRRKRDMLPSPPVLVHCESDSSLKKSPQLSRHKSLTASWATGKDLETKEQRKAWRVAILMFVSLLVHNFPEGLAVAASALESEKLGITVTIGIMIHNIPEGIAIAIPCLAARPDQPWLSFALASISGLAEPIGAFVALLFLRNMEDEMESEMVFMNLENVLAFVAGIMVMVALWELFPEARSYASGVEQHFWFGTLSGIVIMVLTELYLP